MTFRRWPKPCLQLKKCQKCGLKCGNAEKSLRKQLLCNSFATCWTPTEVIAPLRNEMTTTVLLVDSDRQLQTLVVNEHERSKVSKIISKVCCVDSTWRFFLLWLGPMSAKFDFSFFCFEALLEFARHNKRFRNFHNFERRATSRWFLKDAALAMLAVSASCQFKIHKVPGHCAQHTLKCDQAVRHTAN